METNFNIGTTEGGVPILARVTYAQPTFEELQHTFPNIPAYITVNGVRHPWPGFTRLTFIQLNPWYRNLNFEAIDCCQCVSREEREILFEYLISRKRVSTQTVLAEMANRGLRPALYEELLGFHAKYRDLPREFDVKALGSVAKKDGDSFIAHLPLRHNEFPSLGLEPFDKYQWLDGRLFLAVRE